MEKLVLNAIRRDVIGKQVKALRREGKLPAVLYGHGLESTPILLDLRDATKFLSSVGSSTLLTINLDGKEHTALVRERQRDVLSRQLLHIDFQALSLTEKVRAQVAIVLSEDECPAVETYAAMLITDLDQLTIESLPQDLPERIVVDVSGIKEIGDHILVKDLDIPDGVDVLDDPESMIVVASAQAAEEEEAEEVEEVEGEEPEVIERGKKEEEEE